MYRENSKQQFFLVLVVENVASFINALHFLPVYEIINLFFLHITDNLPLIEGSAGYPPFFFLRLPLLMG
jgi:hypothetical protein